MTTFTPHAVIFGCMDRSESVRESALGAILRLLPVIPEHWKLFTKPENLMSEQGWLRLILPLLVKDMDKENGEHGEFFSGTAMRVLRKAMELDVILKSKPLADQVGKAMDEFLIDRLKR